VAAIASQIRIQASWFNVFFAFAFPCLVWAGLGLRDVRVRGLLWKTCSSSRHESESGIDRSASGVLRTYSVLKRDEVLFDKNAHQTIHPRLVYVN
jgi:hypothetical protein